MPAELVGIEPDSRAAGRILIEPNIKQGASPNKRWPDWQKLVDSRPAWPWAQAVNPGVKPLRGVEPLLTRSFGDACRLLAAAEVAVLPEGGLHHAAAALGTPAVVLFGAVVSPRNTGYEQQINLAINEPRGLGWRISSEYCRKAWLLITPEIVATATAKARLTRDTLAAYGCR
jgi:hypothetical protein